MVNFSNLVNYKNIRDAAWLFLIKNNVRCLPLDLQQLSDNNNWVLLMLEDNLDVVCALDKNNYNRSCDGFTCIYKGIVFIIYKHCDNLGRLRFTIAHEFGHITLLHLSKLCNDEYEREANMFAARILMPMCIIKECKAFTPAAISKLCGTSQTAAAFRAKRLQELLSRGKFYTSPYEAQLKIQFDEFINSQKLEG